jgi:hypothetical protein
MVYDVLRMSVVALECFPLTRETMLSSTSWLLPNITLLTLITFITLLTLVAIESIAKRFTHTAHVASTWWLMYNLKRIEHSNNIEGFYAKGMFS